MKLQEFIKETLIDITHALKKANQELSQEYNEGRQMAFYELVRGQNVDDIAFDVAVTVNTEVSGEVDGRVGISVVSLGANVEALSKNECVSRIKFKVAAISPIA